ncbi:hypothetical protein Tco_0011357 [Tanacetum coccineum]
MDKENMKEPVPSDLPPTPFLGHLKEQIGSPYSTRETIHMIRNPEEIHNAKAHREEGDMDVGWDISSKDVERLRQFLTPTIHTLPNLEPVVQPYIPLGPVHDKDKIVREKEQDYDIPLNDSVMQPLTPQTVHITPPDDDYVAPATNPMSNKQLNKSEEEFSHITKDPTARRHLSRLAQLKIMWSNLLEFAAVFGGNEFSLPDSRIEWWKAMEGARVMTRGFEDLVAKLDDNVVMEVLVRCWSDGDLVVRSCRECGELHVDVRVFKSMRRVFQLRVEYKRTNEIDNYVKFRYYQNEVKKKLGRPSS